MSFNLPVYRLCGHAFGDLVHSLINQLELVVDGVDRLRLVEDLAVDFSDLAIDYFQILSNLILFVLVNLLLLELRLQL